MRPALFCVVFMAALGDALVSRRAVSASPFPQAARGEGEQRREGRGENFDALIDDEAEGAAIAAFRARLIAGGLDGVAAEPVDRAVRDAAAAAIWAREAKGDVKSGTILVGNEDFFFGALDEARFKVRHAAFRRLGLSEDAGSRSEARARVLPACILVHAANGKASGIIFGRRSGYMMGDLPDLDTSGFRVQPLLFGGPSKPDAAGGADALARRTAGAGKGKGPSGILALHPYGEVAGSLRLTNDGLFCGGDWAAMQAMVASGGANAFRVQLFVQACLWETGDLDAEIAAGAWRQVECSTELLLKERDRTTPTLWKEIVDLMEKDEEGN
ncbi:hypothetical protein M885DRAFT_531518 [Pelagophyceae sp. CCMP2097]|nr:hypothetical protein M885DRAFT_531518 [Pelagophyceae sp. CCMP2097]